MNKVEMKYSGIEWIGNIPIDWTKTKIRTFVKENSVKFKHLKNAEMIPLSLGAGKVYHRNLDDNKLSDAAENYKLVEKNNLVIGIRAWQNSISVSELYGFVSPAYKVYNLKTNKIFPKYLKYYVNNVRIVNHYITISQGICSDQWKVDDLQFRNLDFFMPPLPQQTAIANYLDHHTTKIDKEISLLEQKVEKLDEYKQALIYETITKGLDKNVPMKDSGIEWIGDIPKHWEVNKFKYCYSKTNSGEVIAKEDWDEIGKPLYSCSKNILRTNFKNFPTHKLTKNNDLLFTRNATPYIFIPKESSLYTNVVQRVTIKNKFYRVYLKYMLEVSNKHLVSYGDIIPSLNMVMWDSLFILNMPKKEQQQIAEYLDEQSSKIDNKKELINKKIELLKEYKQSLIYEAVTGKIEIGE